MVILSLLASTLETQTKSESDVNIEPCIRGHRATSCSHSDRVLVAVRRPGRPLESCEHRLDTCSCGRLSELFSLSNGKSECHILQKGGYLEVDCRQDDIQWAHNVSVPVQPQPVHSAEKPDVKPRSKRRIRKASKKKSMSTPPCTDLGQVIMGGGLHPGRADAESAGFSDVKSTKEDRSPRGEEFLVSSPFDAYREPGNRMESSIVLTNNTINEHQGSNIFNYGNAKHTGGSG